MCCRTARALFRCCLGASDAWRGACTVRTLISGSEPAPELSVPSSGCQSCCSCNCNASCKFYIRGAWAAGCDGPQIFVAPSKLDSGATRDDFTRPWVRKRLSLGYSLLRRPVGIRLVVRRRVLVPRGSTVKVQLPTPLRSPFFLSGNVVSMEL